MFSEHTCENMQTQTKLACAENVCLILQAQLQPLPDILEHSYILCGGSEIRHSHRKIQKSVLQKSLETSQKCQS